MLGDRIREERKRKGLSQEKLGTFLGLTQQSIAKWEKNIAEPDSISIIKLSEIFQVSTDYLLGITNDNNSANHPIIGERLKELRKLRNITQTQLANELNVAIGTVGNWETGQREPAIDMVIRIADYFNVSTDYLIGLTDNKESVLITQIARGSGMTTTEIPLENVKRFEELTETCVIFKEYGKEKKKIKISPDQIDLAISLIETLQKNKI